MPWPAMACNGTRKNSLAEWHSFHAEQIPHASCTMYINSDIMLSCRAPQLFVCATKYLKMCSFVFNTIQISISLFCPSFGLQRIGDFGKRAFWASHRTHNFIDYYLWPARVNSIGFVRIEKSQLTKDLNQLLLSFVAFENLHLSKKANLIQKCE